MSFEILQINGQDVSGSSPQQASAMLQSSSEPISVKLRRTNPKDEAKNMLIFSQSSNTHCQDGDFIKQNNDFSCFCGQLLQNNGYISKSHQPVRHVNDERTQTNKPQLKKNHPESQNQSYWRYEEVTLDRPKNDKKLGITLRDDRDPDTDKARVMVTDVEPCSEAAKLGKIRSGDIIVKIDGFPVGSMEEAAKLLGRQSTFYTFLIARPQYKTSDNINRSTMHLRGSNPRGVNSDVTNPTIENLSHLNNCVTSQGQQHYDVTCKSMTSSPSTRSPSNAINPIQHLRLSNYNRSLSLIDSSAGQKHEITKQNPFQERIRRSSDGDSPTVIDANTEQATSKTKHFVFSKPKKFSFAKRVSFSKESPKNKSDVSPEGAIDIPIFNQRNQPVHQLNEDLKNLHVGQKRSVLTSTSTVEDIEDWIAGVVSPWVQIAREDYEAKLRQLEKETKSNENNPDLISSKHPASSPILPSDNTSSAYSTGESFRSSSSNGEVTKISGELVSSSRPTPANFTDHGHDDASISYTSSDVNSDEEGPACYLSHVDDGSESEGFEDARIEFSPIFTPGSTPLTKPTPLPRIRFPRQDSVEDFKFHPSISPTGTTEVNSSVSNTQYLNGGKHFSRRSSVENNISPFVTQGKTNLNQDFEQETKQFANIQDLRRKTANFTVPDITVRACEEEDDTYSSSMQIDDPENPRLLQMDRLQLRRKSEHALPVRRPFPAQRSISCVESREIHQNDPDGSDSVSMEWKVRIRKDGTRYITKRPVLNQALRLREKRIMADRSAPTSDDDQTEVKLGRHWSRDDRKRQFRVAREKKRRRDFMQRRRMEALTENVAADDEIVELCHMKMSKHKQKRMLFDNFVTVQELLAHGNRDSDMVKANPLLNVTYI